MMIANGKINKRTFCPVCFSAITWDNPDAEKNGSVKCPKCKAAVKASSAEIIFVDEINKENISALVDGVAYENLEEAIAAFSKKGGEIVLTKDTTLTQKLVLENDVTGTITLENCKLDLGADYIRVAYGSNITINADENSSITSTGVLLEAVDAKVTLNGGNYSSGSWGVRTAKTTVISLNGLKMEAKEACIMPYVDSTIIINNCELTSKDNFVVGTNGRESENGTKKSITIINSVLNGEITSNGYISCGVYLASEANVTIKNSTINSASGCGILLRAGQVKLLKTKIDVHGNITGKVGEGATLIGCDGIAYDTVTGYLGNENIQVTIGEGTKITCENEQRIGLYLNEGEEPNIVDKGE